jgi:putative nucleotidyltransferase with HDIG domain
MSTALHASIIIRGLFRTIRLYEQNTADHCYRVANLAAQLARDLSFTSADLEKVYDAGLLHDLGKIFVPKHIILKPTELDTEEMNVMRNHANWGCEIIKSYEHPYLDSIAELVDCHHEHFDGTGYLKSLQRNKIPELSRVIAIVDSYDAIMELRSYHCQKTRDETIEIMLNDMVGKFDKEYLNVFINSTLTSIDTSLRY